ncbi:MAG TPA: hypothetical protein VMU03_11840 [Gammaproteobacteria bacterium]|nr:hypothetical protein [Gammaproteobacteria bacterium]
MVALIAALSASADTQERKETLSIDDPRPVAAALQQLMTRHQRVITYEDPRYLHEGDIKDVTREVRKDLDRYPPGQAPTVLAPRGGHIRFGSRVSTDTGQPDDWNALLTSLLEGYAARGGPRFRVEHHADFDHVIPAESRNASGQWVKAASILDATVTIPEQELTKADIVEAVAKAVSAATDVHFVVGTCLVCGPHGLAPEPTERFAVHDERARDLLWRAVQHWRPGTSWHIYQDPGSDLYVLNLVRGPAPATAPAPALPVLPSPPSTDSRCKPAMTRAEAAGCAQ